MSKPSIWTEDELKFMRENYAILGTREMSKKLNRTYGSVQVKARRMGLNSRTDIWSDSEIVIIDGDGSVLYYPDKGKSFYVGFYGNDYMVSYVNKTLNEILGVSLVKQRYRFSSDGCYVSVVSIRYGKKDSFKICDYLYRDVDQSLYMNRKHNSYINALKDYRVIK